MRRYPYTEVACSQRTRPVTSSYSSALQVGVVEDESRLRELLVREIRAMGHHAEGFAAAEQAWPRIRAGLDAVILDLNLPGMAGMELFRRIRKEELNTAVVILTGFGAFDSAVQSVRWKAEDYLTKPCSLADIDRALSRVLARKLESGRRLATEQLDEPVPEVLPARDSDSTHSSTDPKGATLAEIERIRIIQALEKHGGNKPAVAAELGISLRTLYNRLNVYKHQGFIQ